MILTPAYGRDYKSAKAAVADYLDGKDFVLHDVSSPYNGKYCSCRDFPNQLVQIRYAAMRRVTIATWNDEE